MNPPPALPNYSPGHDVVFVGIKYSGIEEVASGFGFQTFIDDAPASVVASRDKAAWASALKVAIVRDPISRAMFSYAKWKSAGDPRVSGLSPVAWIRRHLLTGHHKQRPQKKYLDRKIDILIGAPHLAEAHNFFNWPSVRWTQEAMWIRDWRSMIPGDLKEELAAFFIDEIQWLSTTPVWTPPGSAPRTLFGDCENCTNKPQ